LEAFADTALHLHVCQTIDAHFNEVYSRELTECRNIHFYGYVPMRSTHFETLAKSCNWVISATCAEGQPGAIIECMGYGLIPILPESANMTLGDIGIPLQECTIEHIRETALGLAHMRSEECRRRSLQAHATVKTEYSPEGFNISFKKAIQKIVEACRMK
jgi:hypothetical protein